MKVTEIKTIVKAAVASMPKEYIIFVAIGVGWAVAFGGYIFISSKKNYSAWDQRFNLKEEAMRDKYLTKDMSERVSKRAF